MGRSRGRHAAPRSRFSKVVGAVAGGVGLLVVGGILVSVAVPIASSGSAANPSPTPEARVSVFQLKGSAEGPTKTPPAPVAQPKTVLDPYAVADPYDIPAAPVHAPAPAPSSSTPAG